MQTEKQNNPFTKYQFIDEHGHSLENSKEFQELKEEIQLLTDTAVKYARSKSSLNLMRKVNSIREKWGLERARA